VEVAPAGVAEDTADDRGAGDADTGFGFVFQLLAALLVGAPAGAGVLLPVGGGLDVREAAAPDARVVVEDARDDLVLGNLGTGEARRGRAVDDDGERVERCGVVRAAGAV